MTTDVRMTATGNLYDLSLDDSGDLDNGDFLDSSLLYSLLGERRASESEVPEASRRRGWLGNVDQTFENGSKLWLYEQARISRSVLSGISSAALDGLQWLVDDGLLQDVQANATLSNSSIVLDIPLIRFDDTVEHRFFTLWNNTGIG